MSNKDDKVIMTGRVLTYDKICKNGMLFPSNCKINIPEKCILINNFIKEENIGTVTSFNKNEKGINCTVEINSNYNFLNKYVIRHIFDNKLPIGGYYNKVKSHRVNGITIIEEATLVGVSIISLRPVDDELFLFLEEE